MEELPEQHQVEPTVGKMNKQIIRKEITDIYIGHLSVQSHA
jgi:hypothetical protein